MPIHLDAVLQEWILRICRAFSVERNDHNIHYKPLDVGGNGCTMSQGRSRHWFPNTAGRFRNLCYPCHPFRFIPSSGGWPKVWRKKCQQLRRIEMGPDWSLSWGRLDGLRPPKADCVQGICDILLLALGNHSHSGHVSCRNTT